MYNLIADEAAFSSRLSALLGAYVCNPINRHIDHIKKRTWWTLFWSKMFDSFCEPRIFSISFKLTDTLYILFPFFFLSPSSSSFICAFRRIMIIHTNKLKSMCVPLWVSAGVCMPHRAAALSCCCRCCCF